MALSLGVERQKQLLGMTDIEEQVSDVRIAEIHEAAEKWWLKDVMGPAKGIVGNPAASCAVAQVSMTTLLGMMRQRQLLGMSSDDSGAVSTRDAELDKMFDDIQAKGLERGRDEALDECVATGRIKQIPQTAISQIRQSQLLGGELNIEEWAKDSLKQCAIDELHFVSTTHFDNEYTVDTVMDGKIKLEFVEDGGPMLGMTPKGESKGGNKFFLVSIKCQGLEGISIACSPGVTLLSSYIAKILDMELKHREFYTGLYDVSAERTAGDDKLVVKFWVGMLMGQVVWGGSTTAPFPIGGTEFIVAHKKDYSGTDSSVKFEHNKRGVYPIVFDFIYADQNVVESTHANDSTHFELIHKIRDEIMKKLNAKAITTTNNKYGRSVSKTEAIPNAPNPKATAKTGRIQHRLDAIATTIALPKNIF